MIYNIKKGKKGVNILKTVAKVFIILSIVAAAFMVLLSAIMIVSGLLMLNMGEFAGASILIMGVIYLIISIPMLIINIIGLKKVSAAKCADDVSIAWKVLVLLFSNVISGILLLIMKDEDYLTEAEKAEKKSQDECAKSACATNSEKFDDLLKLKSLLDAGVITEEEYNAKKKEIL